MANIFALIVLAGVLSFPTLSASYQIRRAYPQRDLATNVAGGACLPVSILESGASYVKFLSRRDYELNDEGFVSYNYGEAYDQAGWQTTPLHVARLGMSGLRAWCMDGDEIGLAIALRHADWLVENAHYVSDEHAVWLYQFPQVWFQAESGWTGGMANAYAIAFLTQMYHVTGNAAYRDLVDKGVQSFALEMDEGGTSVLMDDGQSLFFEEVAQPGITPGHILNGHLFAVAGLAYVGDHFDDQQALELFERGARAVAEYGPLFNAGEVTYYSLGPEKPAERPVGHYAHRVHARYSAYLYNRLGDPRFKEYALLWAEDAEYSFKEVDGKLLLDN